MIDLLNCSKIRDKNAQIKGSVFAYIFCIFLMYNNKIKLIKNINYDRGKLFMVV